MQEIRNDNTVTEKNETGTKLKDRKGMFIALGLILILVPTLVLLGVPKEIVAFVTVVLSLLTQAFAGLAALIAMIPFIGPIIVKVLSIPFFWLVNALGYFVSVLAIKKGYTKQVISSRVLTIAVLVGIVIGYILGNFLPLF
ncbi:MAG: hypothetical protein ACE5EE_09820 [Fidelibacterota bacterium]